MTDFKINDLVWGKLTGYEIWPAQIVDPHEKEEDIKEGYHCVVFLASHNYAFLPPEKLWPYKKYKEKYSKSYKSVKKWPQLYRKALLLAEQFSEELDYEAQRLVRVCCSTWTADLVTNMMGLQATGTLCDVIMFDGCGKEVCLHSIILACCSTWWQSVFKEVCLVSPDGSYTYSFKTSPLNMSIWRVIINLMYTGDASLPSEEMFTDVLQQMQAMKLDVLLDHLSQTLDHNTWKAVLCRTILEYQERDKMCDLRLVDAPCETPPSPSPSSSSSSSSSLAFSDRSPTPSTFCVKSHALLFISSCGYLRKELQKQSHLLSTSSSSASGMYTLSISGIDDTLWDRIISFIYTGATEVEISKVESLSKLALKLEMPLLLKAIEESEPIDMVSRDKTTQIQEPLSKKMDDADTAGSEGDGVSDDAMKA